MELYVELVCFAVLLLSPLGEGNQHCKQDSDCEHLGGLICVRSMCEWGVCGCRRGFVSRFVGSEEKFQCVRIRKIGESCSTSGTGGVCGGEYSVCDDGVCTCQGGSESRWGGETCLPIKDDLSPSESCSIGIGVCDVTTSTCGTGGLFPYTGQPLNSLPGSPFDEIPTGCVCGQGWRTSVRGDYDAAPAIGSRKPECVANAVGDLCLTDADCGLISDPDGAGDWKTGAATCVSNACVCPANMVVDITGLYCATALGMGAACATNNIAVLSSVGVCDGSIGLRCGDPCDVATHAGTGDHGCICDPGWSGESGSCLKRTLGGSCFGDYNCKSIGDDSVCTDGLCTTYRNSGPSVVCPAASALLAVITLTIKLMQPN